MDNDNKINENQEIKTHREVQLFLKDELKNLSFSKAAQYDLEKEYALTKNNRNKSVGIILIVLVAAVVLVTAGLSVCINSSNENISVNIDTFNDLNLRALLNSAGRTESLYLNAVRTKENLVSQRDDELAAAAQKRENDLFVLQSVSKVSTASALNKKKDEIQQVYKKTVKEIQERYSSKIAAAEKEIQEYKAKLSGYDKEKLAQADGSLVDSQKQLNDLEMSNLEKRYQDRISELKKQMSLQQREAVKQQREAVEQVRKTYQAKIDLLDPDARSQSKVQDQIILETGIPKSAKTTAAIEFKEHFDGSVYTSPFKSPSEVFTSSIKNASESLEDLNTIAWRFSSIPLENTIRHYVPAMQRLAYQITTNMAEAQKEMQTEIDGLKDTLAQKDLYITELEETFNNICTQDKNAVSEACIVNASDKNSVVLFVTKAGKAMFTEDGQSLDALVKEGKKTVFELTVTKNNTRYTAAPKAGSKYTNKNALMTGAKVFFVLPGTEVKK